MRIYPLLLAFAFVGCKTTENKPDDSGVVDSEADSDTDSDSDSDTDTDTDSDTDTDTTCWVDWAEGTCWDCDLPTTAESDSLKFLNQCTDVAYSKFDNAARIPASTWVPGTPLPSL